MKDFVLYEDDEKKIEIDGYFHWLMKQLAIKDFRLQPQEMNYLLDLAFGILKDKNIKFTNTTIINNIPVIESQWPINLAPPYDIFNDIMQALSEYDSLDDNTPLILKELEDEFLSSGFFVHIFSHYIYDVKGFLVFQSPEHSYLMFFGFKENNFDDSFLEDFL